MPEGKTISIAKGEYPQLEDMGDKNTFTFSGEGMVEWNGEQGTITLNSFNVETENKADREMRNLKGPKQSSFKNEEEVEI